MICRMHVIFGVAVFREAGSTQQVVKHTMQLPPKSLFQLNNTAKKLTPEQVKVLRQGVRNTKYITN